MHSSWMNRLFRHADVGSRVLAQAPLSLSALPPQMVTKKQVPRTPAANAPRTKRLCLGIGDGSVHRQ